MNTHTIYLLSDPDNNWRTKLWVDIQRVGVVVKVDDNYYESLVGKTINEVREWAAKRGFQLDHVKH